MLSMINQLSAFLEITPNNAVFPSNPPKFTRMVNLG